MEFEKQTGISLINPFYDIPREDVKKIDAGLMSVGKTNPTTVVKRDVKLIKKAKIGLVAIINGCKSYGTCQEMIYAKRIFNKKVYSIITNGDHEHPWLRYHSDKIFTTFRDFEECIIEQTY